MRLTSNAREVELIYASRRTRWGAARRSGLRKAVVAVENAASELLSGSGAAGAYPVPVRTGHLRRSMGSKMQGDSAGAVYNSAEYARAIHDGVVGRWNGRGKVAIVQVRARPFMTDAVEKADPTAIVHDELRAAL